MFKRLSVLCLLVAAALSAQSNTLVQTSLSSAITASSQTFSIASATGITATLAAPTVLYIDREFMPVISISGTSVTVQRGANGTHSAPHVSGAMVLAGRPTWFYAQDPTGNCVTASTKVTPWLNIATGDQWLCSTITLSWVPGFVNAAARPAVTTAVASAAGQVLPTGPLFHISGTNAITGFTYPIGVSVGQASGGFCTIPDGAFTWTTANNIALAGTAVVNRLLCFAWDGTNAKWVPSYV